ncbi:MAG: hypothetical protein IJU64_06615 [Bacilli bacterium]|nr:hypothetical protein [Bacilli bacterium]
MKLRKAHIFSAAMVLALTASFAGAISGTVAWYASSTRVTMSYQGTSVAQSEQLQIGLVSDVDFTQDVIDAQHHVVNLGLTHEEINGEDIYWAKAGSGLNSVAIQAYLARQGYATNELTPVSSYGYANGDNLALKKAPMAYSTEIYDAGKTAYCKIDFVFRVIHTGATGNIYAKNENIWITDALATTGGDASHQIYRALRLHFDGATKLILNPGVGKEALAGDTKVAGLLDLNNDGFYDYDASEEIVYGRYAKTAAHPDNNPANHLTHFGADTGLDDVNDYYVNPGRTNASTFYGKHKEGVDGYTTSDFASFVTPELAHYETLKSIAPTDNGAGYLTGGTPLCVTANDDAALAHLTMSVYLEGWDHAVIDDEISHQFNLGLQFQINRAL